MRMNVLADADFVSGAPDGGAVFRYRIAAQQGREGDLVPLWYVIGYRDLPTTHRDRVPTNQRSEGHRDVIARMALPC